MNVPTNKKRKLNSKNPKYQKIIDAKVRKEFVAEVKGVKISKVYYI
jgi:hypothetical protein|tara:strand:+ start:915 stop:1052 length:138 start_codon:yes stop_codon:yes gene_type:complete